MTELALYDCTVISSYHTHSHYPDTDSTSPSTTLTMPAGSKGATRTICKDLSMFRPGMKPATSHTQGQLSTTEPVDNVYCNTLFDVIVLIYV